MDCLFCNIIKGKIPSHKIYEDEETYAFLDINPCSRGHTVVVPKKHYDSFTDMPTEDAGSLFATVKMLTGMLEDAMSADGSNVGLNNKAAAGQLVPHVHVHIIPRMNGDNGGSMHSIVSVSDAGNDLEELAERLRVD
ncbi:HIT family protein [Methanococcoides burtonii]|uniref:Histidine triad protein n=1 Tax=Methanococcoides burtonii (strain DSM 6242 / NBRC 107633 / OCM 468 / ACE-M) TaxID=259564 RepID=Q12VT8_METBU|nr:HIT family protein [Methanococcoides burtonii]ABE52438.1 Histidine triad protein [Methanococcoides burtonii DSM 6242]